MKSTLKIIVSFIATIIIVFSFNTLAFANNYKSFECDDLDLNISVPEDFVVFTRNYFEDKNLMKELGYNKTSLVSYFESSNIYFNAYDKTNNQEIVVTMADNTIKDFNLVSETLLSSIADSLFDAYKDYDREIIKYNFYQHSQAKFIIIYFKDLNANSYGLQYYTVYNNKAYNFTLRVYGSEIKPKNRAVIKDVVDTVRFNVEPITLATENSESYVYEDNKSGVSFIVPDNWKEKDFSEPKKYLDVMFESTIEKGIIIAYGGSDMWSQLDSQYKNLVSRDYFDKLGFTKEDAASFLECDPSDVVEETYNGISYYQATIKEYVSGLNVTVTKCFTIKNGWMFMFYFYGDTNASLYSDFVELLNSVNYNNQISKINSENASKHNANIFIIVSVLIVVLLAIVLLFIFLKSKNKKSETTNEKSSMNQEKKPIVDNILKIEEPIVYCHKCGQKQTSESLFCYKCGTKLR